MKNNLAEGSKSYHSEAYIYERFSQVEDTPQIIRKVLEPTLKEKDILDVGCGTGKYLSCFAPLSKKYYALDISKEQLDIAKSKARGSNNVTFLCSSAENINLPNETVDIIISTWVLGTILDENRRGKVVQEMERVLRMGGEIYLVENDIGGEFETIRDRYPEVSRTKEYNDWLENKGFKPIKKLETYFKFGSLQEAIDVFSSIWGEKVKRNINTERIEHRVVIYKKDSIDAMGNVDF